ncbi:MAG: MarR family transcriptional regulator [Nocardioides sp.]|nr:MarR family transcriptional regulator [Nocardioides sp.]
MSTMTPAEQPLRTPSVRDDSLRELEREVGVLIRRIRRVIGVRARAVHEDLQPSAYLMLSWLVDEGPVRASAMVDWFNIDKGAVSRQLQQLVDLGLVDRTPDPGDGRATLVSASTEGVRRLADVAAGRRRLLDERLSDWSAPELEGFVALLSRYNAALD